MDPAATTLAASFSSTFLTILSSSLDCTAQPRKSTVVPRTPIAEMPAIKKNKGGAVERPARGYHKFKNGMLNVTPKGSETEL
jgi:hypothetical protein